MKFFLFFFLLCVPHVWGIAVSPASVVFEGNSAELYLINDHSSETQYLVDGPVFKQTVVLAPYDRKLLIVKLQKNAEESGVIEIREVLNTTGFSVIAGLDVPYTVKESFPVEQVREFSNAVTGNAVRLRNTLPENLWVYGIVGIVVLVGILFLMFPKERKVVHQKEFSHKWRWKNARKVKYNKVR